MRNQLSKTEQFSWLKKSVTRVLANLSDHKTPQLHPMFNRNAYNQACLQSSQILATMPPRQGINIAIVQEAAWRSRLTSTETFEQLTQQLPKGPQP